jgi:hypothetical protein
VHSEQEQPQQQEQPEVELGYDSEDDVSLQVQDDGIPERLKELQAKVDKRLYGDQSKPEGALRWKGDYEKINRAGRPPKKFAVLEKKTNRQIREQEFLGLLRKFKPYLTKAVQTQIHIMGADGTSDQNKLKASAFIIGMYRDLLKDGFDYRYDESEATPVQDNTPVFSLKMINGDDTPDDYLDDDK